VKDNLNDPDSLDTVKVEAAIRTKLGELTTALAADPA
jgi:hypothetical protein